jgi:spermidine/putrescine transport system permease protein
MMAVSQTRPASKTTLIFERINQQIRVGFPIYIWLAVLVLLPNVLLVLVSFMKASGGVVQFNPGISNYLRLTQSESFWVLLIRTISTAAMAAGLATLIAYPMAYYASRKLARGRLVALFLVVVPLWISLLMRIFAWKIILGEKGILNSFLLSTGILSEPSTALLYTPFSVLLTFTYVSIPFVFVTSYSALDRIPNSLLEAAQDSGASPLYSFLNVMWPLSRSGAAIGFSLAFLLCIGDYITPSMVGGLDGTMVGMVIASQFGLAGNWPYGSAIAIVLIFFVVAILAFTVWLVQTPGVLMGEDNAAPIAKEKAKNWSWERFIALGGFALFCIPFLFLYLPLVFIVIFSFNDSTLQAFPLVGFTTKWYAGLGSNAPMLAALTRSLEVGATVLLLSIIAGTLFAVIIAYGKLSGNRAIELLLSVPIAIPGVVLGITMVLACQLLRVPVGLPRIVMGHSSFVMPVIMSIVLNRLRRLDPSLIEAALDCGANRFQAFYYVLLPLIRGSIIGGALLGFTLSVDEVVVTLFLTGVEPTLPVWVWNQMRFGFTPSVNAIFTLIGGATLLLILVAQKLTTGKT